MTVGRISQDCITISAHVLLTVPNDPVVVGRGDNEQAQAEDKGHKHCSRHCVKFDTIAAESQLFIIDAQSLCMNVSTFLCGLCFKEKLCDRIRYDLVWDQRYSNDKGWQLFPFCKTGSKVDTKFSRESFVLQQLSH